MPHVQPATGHGLSARVASYHCVPTGGKGVLGYTLKARFAAHRFEFAEGISIAGSHICQHDEAEGWGISAFCTVLIQKKRLERQLSF